jgi:asparagine synthase (glutamine-hydrolysing)
LRIPFYKSRIINLLKPGISLFETYLLFRGITTVSELRKKFGTELIDEFLHEINFQYYNSLSANNNEEIKGVLRFFEYEFYLKNQLLKDADWASMYHSIELRVPFVNMNFIKEISSLNLNDNSDKKDLVNSVNQFYPLLEEVYNKNKKSFTTPLKLWFSKKFSYKNKTDNKILLNIIYEKYLNSFDKNKL